METSRRSASERIDPALAAVGVLALLALVLRLPHLGESLVGDEMYAFAETNDRGLLDVLERVREGGENSPPLYFLLAWLPMQLGDPTVLIRLPSLVLGTAAVPLVYLIGVRTVGRTAALIATAVIALSPFAIYYSSEARPYGTLMFCVALSTLLLLRAIESGRPRWWVLYAIAGCAVLYAHYFGVFPLIAQGVWALWTDRGRLRVLAAVYAGIAIGYVPWILAFLDQKGNSISILAFYAPLTLRGAGRELLRLFPGHPSFAPSDLPGTAAVVLVALAILAALVAARVADRRAGSPPRPSDRLVLVALLAVATPVGFTLYSAAGPELFIGRYLSGALPFVALLVGAILAAPPRPVSVAATTVVVAVLAFGAVESLQDERRRPAYKDAAHYIDDAARPGDAVVQLDLTLGATKSQVTTGGRQLSLDVNFDRDHDVFSAFEENDIVRVYGQAARRSRFLLVGPERLPDPPPGLGARLADRREFVGLLPLEVRVYEPADPARGFDPGALAQAQGLARRRERRADAVGRCLRAAGLDARRAETSPPGSITLEARLAGGGRSLLYVYPTAARASDELPAIQRFLAAGGGRATRVGATVIAYTGAPPGAAAGRVEGCA